MMAIRLVLADDHALFRQGLRAVLCHERDVEIVGEAECVDGLAGLVERAAANVLLLDLKMERSSLPEIATLADRLPIIVVTASELVGDALAAFRAGARAVVFKRFAIETLMDAIRTVVAGDVWMPSTVQGELASRLRGACRSPLSIREEEVARCVALGLRNADVARKLFISEQTVKSHLNKIFEKLGVQDRVELTVFAIRSGLVGLHEWP